MNKNSQVIDHSLAYNGAPYELTIKWPGEEEEVIKYNSLAEASDAKYAALALGSYDNKPTVRLEDSSGRRL